MPEDESPSSTPSSTPDRTFIVLSTVTIEVSNVMTYIDFLSIQRIF
jgi:hypothetical protein